MQVQVSFSGSMGDVSKLMGMLANAEGDSLMETLETKVKTEEGVNLKRKRRTKAEMEAAKDEEDEQEESDEFEPAKRRAKADDEDEEEDEETEDDSDEETEEDEEEEKPAKKVKGSTLDDMRQACRSAAKKHSVEHVAKILKKYKIKSINELPENKYSEVAKLLKV